MDVLLASKSRKYEHGVKMLWKQRIEEGMEKNHCATLQRQWSICRS